MALSNPAPHPTKFRAEVKKEQNHAAARSVYLHGILWEDLDIYYLCFSPSLTASDQMKDDCAGWIRRKVDGGKFLWIFCKPKVKIQMEDQVAN